MKLFFKKINKEGKRPACRQSGMTYVELIVVLSIFSIFSGMAIFNYKDFQGKVDVKNLANDIALKVVQAQKDSLAGKLPIQPFTDPDWKPSYGIYFNNTPDTSADPNTGDKVFYYFVDTYIPKNNQFDHLAFSCPNTGECVDKIKISKGNYIVNVKSFNGGTSSVIDGDFSISFTRPNSSAVFYNNSLPLSAEYVEVTVSTPGGLQSHIDIYPSGRVQIN